FRCEALKGLDATTTVDVGHVDRYASSAAGPAFAAKHRATAWWSSPASRRDGNPDVKRDDTHPPPKGRRCRDQTTCQGRVPLRRPGDETARVTATAPRTAQIITPLGPVSSTAKGR